jgi:hypothetical protein
MKQGEYPKTIQVDDDVFDLLRRTADSRDTDINGALLYLMEAPGLPATAAHEDDNE